MHESVRIAPMTLMAGLACGIGTIAVHQEWWGLLLGAAATAAVLVAAPAGLWTRIPFAAGYAGVVGLASVPRAEGDYLLAGNVAGYLVLGLALGVLTFAVATLLRPRKSPAEEAPGFLP